MIGSLSTSSALSSTTSMPSTTTAATATNTSSSSSSSALAPAATPSGQASHHNSANLIALSTTIQQFDTIRKWLIKNHKKYVENDQPSNKQLSHFLGQFVQFQEDNLGCNALKPLPPTTRLPVKLVAFFSILQNVLSLFFLNILCHPLTSRHQFEVLIDFQIGGALCHLFSVVYKHKYEQKM